MKLIKPSFEILQPFNCLDPVESAKRAIERAGRVSYKSEDKITDRSWIRFFDMLKEKKHLSVFEFGELFFRIPVGTPFYDKEYLYKISIIQFFKNNQFSKCNTVSEEISMLEQRVHYISTNFRVIQEHSDFIDWKWLSQYLCQPTDNHERKITVKFICSRGISHELVRHRVNMSYVQESQRYVNYSKDKFGNEITFIMPEYGINCPKFIESLERAEKDYFYLLGLGWKPQEAREVLPNATKTEIIVTGFRENWKHFFDLRTADSAHPEMRRLTIPLQEEFKKLGYV